MPTVLAERPDMTAYGVDRPDWHPLPWQWAAERLAVERNYWLGTVDRTARPHSMPLWAVWSEAEHQLMFSCAPTSLKARNLQRNPMTVVTSTDTVECISLEGTSVQLDRTSRADIWIERYLEKYSAIAPALDADFLRSNAMFEFTPERGFGVIEREEDFSTRATRWRFVR